MEQQNAEGHDNVKAAKSSRPKPRRALIAVAIVVVVVVAAGAGFAVWHEKPSFCGAICHSPMDPYLQTYEQSTSDSGVDKWGNDIEDASCMLAPVHREAGKNCLDCHEATLSEQVSEGMAWVSGNYESPLNEKTLSQLTAASGKSDDEFCLNESCHNMTREQLKDMTADEFGVYNPHDSHHGELACGTCHKAHRASVMYCTQCHAAVVPDGWLSMGEANQLTDVSEDSLQ